MGKFYSGQDLELRTIDDALALYEREAKGHAVTQIQRQKMLSEIGLIGLLLKNPNATQPNFRKVIDKKLEGLLEIAPGSIRSGSTTIHNKGDIRPAKPYWALEFNAPNYMVNNQIAHDGYVYVVMASRPYEVRIGTRAHGGHTAISRGANVYYAGEIMFNHGTLVYWDNNSGHYRPGAAQHNQIKHLLPIAQYQDRPIN